MTILTNGHTETPAIQSSALTWWKYDVAQQQSLCGLLSLAARGLDAALTDDAWANPDGSCSVSAARLAHRCAKEGLDAKALWEELRLSGRWERSEDGKVITASWLVALRHDAARTIEKRRRAGKASGRARSEKAAKRGGRPRATAKPTGTGKAGEHVLNTCSDSRAVLDANALDVRAAPETGAGNVLPSNELNTCSTHGEQKREESRTTDLSSRGHVVQLSAGDESPAATSPAASHAGGAAALVAPAPAGARVVPDLKALVVEERIRAVEPPIAWMDADLPVLVEALHAAGTGVDVERALYRACAGHQKRHGVEAHLPLLEELRRGLAGADGRGGLLGVGDAAARSLALALHGAAVMEFPPAPLILRAVAGAIDRELREHGDQGDAKRMAVRIALDFSRGHRKASGYTLPGEDGPTPRLLGHPTRAEVGV
jgi:hypothetical protein